jgi:hypothetical protein
MKLGQHDQKLIDTVVRAIDVRCGTRLSAVVLCGDAAAPNYIPGKTRLELAVVVDAVSADVLRDTANLLGFRARRRVAPPLLFDAAYIRSALDVFPLEFLDLSDRHVLLHGTDDPFFELEFEREHMRLQVEQQLRGKLLHLWEAYLVARGSRWRVRRMLIQTPAAFEMIARGILYLTGADRPTDPFGLLDEVAGSIGIALPTLARLERVRAGTEKLPGAEVEATFANYLDEVRSLVKGVDQL